MYERRQGPMFSPGTPIERSPDRSFTALPRLDFMRGYTISDYNVMSRIRELLQKGGPLVEVGRGGDMAAYSLSDLGFVIKFPYDDTSMQPTGFNYRISYGYSLAKEYLGGIFAPSIDVYGIFTDADGEEHGILTLVQQKVKPIREVFRTLASQERFDEISRIKQTFIELNQKMWERRMFDCDTAWEENYGLLPDGMLALIDVGYLSDDPKDFPLYEGMPRTSQYEADLRNNFTEENFTHFFGKKPRTRTRSPNPQAKSLLLA